MQENEKKKQSILQVSFINKIIFEKPLETP